MNEHIYTLAQFKRWLINTNKSANMNVLTCIAALEADAVLDKVNDCAQWILAGAKRWIINEINGNECYSYEKDAYKESLMHLINLEVEAILGEDDPNTAQEDENVQTD